MKQRTEAEILEHMRLVYGRCDGKLSGRIESWIGAKMRALDAVLQDASKGGPPDEHAPLSFLDIGIGDMLHWERWAPFREGTIDYVGLDGCGVVLHAAMERHPEMEFIAGKFSDVVESHREGHTWPVDCLVALDVLFHIPDDDVYEGMLDMLFMAGEHRYVLVSYSTGMEKPVGKKPGDPGYARVPREWQEPAGWDLLYTGAHSAVGKERQQLKLYKRA